MLYFSVYSLLSTLGLFVGRRVEWLWLAGVMSFLLWFMGGRHNVGCDFGGYLNRFNGLPENIDWTEVLGNSEPGFQFLISAVRAMGLDYVWLNVSATIFILGGLYVFLRAQRNALMILALMFPICLVQLGMSGIRQAIAVSFLLFASVQFMAGKRIATAALILIGSLFHASAIAFLPIALLAGRRVSTVRLVVAVGVVVPVVFFLMADRLDVYQDRYIDQIYGEMSSGGAVFRYMLALVPVPFFLLYRNRIRTAFSYQYELLKLFALIIVALAPLVILSSIILHRLNYYVLPFSIVMLVYLSRVVFRPDQRLLGRFMPVVLYGVYMIGWLATSRHAELCYMPYSNYLFV